MKTSLEHLPEDKRALLDRAVATIRAEVPEAGMIILFGSHARGDQVHNPQTGYRSDYDLLVVVDGEETARNVTLWDRVRDAIKEHTTTATVDIIVHDFREVNEQIRRGQFFFVEIWQQGIVLFDARRFTLARPKAATPEERGALAQEYFDHWLTSASTFFKTYKFLLGEGDHSIAAFQLHQATERYFATALLVFTGTKPTIHKLNELAALVAPLHPLLAEPFPMGTEEDRHLFNLLRRAYIEARYSKSYRITAEELAALGERVKDLASRVERACREQIETYAAGDGAASGEARR
ncbi:MAG: HEPN domain-containing protein [Minicystis sp.]